MPKPANKFKSVSIPVKGDRDFRDTVHMLAFRKRLTTAELVRDALDKVYGPELAWVESLRAESVAPAQQSAPVSASRKSEHVA